MINHSPLTLIAVALMVLAATTAAEPVMFVTVTPMTGGTISGTFRHFVSFVGNHEGTATRAPRGGDLYIRYDDGTLRNLTAEAGYGLVAGQEICVREPNIHWDGAKAIFSMAVGGTGANPAPSYFQLYEATGILQGQTVQITKLPQPANFNNVQPCYATDDSIIFATDMPATQDPNHYPQLDEYESTPVVSGLWKMNPDGTGLTILDHCPSGDFTPIVDSFGRVIFTRWDHLKRDQQSDLWVDGEVRKETEPAYNNSRAKPVTFPSEASTAFTLVQFGDEFFPENGRLHPGINTGQNPGKIPHPYWDQDFLPGTAAHDFNFFFPWMMNEDGTDMEVLNHLGRHEFFGFVPKAHDNEDDFFRSGSVFVRSFNQVREHPTIPGRYYGIDAAEFGTHGAGRMILFDAPMGANPDGVPATMKDVTPPNAADWQGGVRLTLFRDPMIRADGSLWAACNGTPDFATSTASDPGGTNPYPLSSNYSFKIRKLTLNSKGFYEPSGAPLVADIVKGVSYVTDGFWPIRPLQYSGPLWELFPVSVVPRARPTPTQEVLPQVEKDLLEEKLGGPAGVAALRQWLEEQDMALISVRDVTMRADKQQPYNLKVPSSGHGHGEVGEPRTNVAWMQMLVARYVRGYTYSSNLSSVQPGRRLLARILESIDGPVHSGAPEGSVRVAGDGSVAAFVPARRALSWQLTEPDGKPVVRERYWLTFQPGEIRTCTNCHGINTTDVFGNGIPTNTPQALGELIDWWKVSNQPASATGWMLY